MRNKILFILLLLIAFSLGVLSVRAYDDYQSHKAAENAAAAQREADREAAAQKLEEQRAAEEAAEKQHLQEVCQSLTDNWNKLTPFQKTQTEEPNCDLKQVE